MRWVGGGYDSETLEEVLLELLVRRVRSCWASSGCDSLFAGSSLVDLCDNHGNNNDNNDDEQHNKQAPPLLAVPAARLLDRASNLGVGLHNVVVDLLALLLDVGHKRLLLLHDLVQVLEKLGQLDHLALDVLDRLVALFDVAEGAGGLAAAVRVEKL